MGFGAAIGSCFRNYVRFRGRAPRSEYWYFILFTVLLSIPAAIADTVIAPGHQQGPASTILSLGLFLPQLSVTVRRLHDTNRSGFWLLAMYIYIIAVVVFAVALFGVAILQDQGQPNIDSGSLPLISFLAMVLGMLAFIIWLFVITLLRGTQGANDYGADPFGPDADVF